MTTELKACSLSGATCATYLNLASEAVARGQWQQVAALATEAAKYALIEDRIGRAVGRREDH